MAKVLLKEIDSNIELYRDSRTGVAWVENGRTGNQHSCHPNIDATGSVKGMKNLGYWNKEDRTIKTRGTIYNIDKLVVTDQLDELAKQYCKCGGKH